MNATHNNNISDSMSQLKSAHTAANGEAGFTIIETMIAVMLFLIVTGSVYGLLEVARSDRSRTSTRVEMMQSVRNALNAMGRDAHNAGYGYRRYDSLLPDDAINSLTGIGADQGTAPDRLSRVVAGNDITTNSLSGKKTDQVTFVFGDDTFNPNDYGVGTPIDVTWTDCQDGNQVITQRSDARMLNINDIVIIAGAGKSSIGMVTGKRIDSSIPPKPRCPDAGLQPPTAHILFDATDPLGINRTGAENTIRQVTPPATIQRINIVTYRVLADGTLVRNVHRGNSATTTSIGSQDQPLAYNVEDMQIKYIMADGTETDNPVVGADGIAGTDDDIPKSIEDVRQVRITVIAQNRDKRTIVTDANGLTREEPTRVTLSSTFNARNLVYDPSR